MTVEQTGSRPAFIDSCLGNRVSRVPIWIMRQSSRYLPEYRDLRERHSYRDLCVTPELAVEATLQPVRRYGLDAGLLFTDPLLFLEPLGVDVDFDDGPHLSETVRTRGGVDRLRFRSGIAEELGYLRETVTRAAEELGDTPLIGVCGAPFTLAGYLVEGHTSRSHQHLKALLYNDPKAAHSLFEQLADLVVQALTLQIEAGAEAFLLLDSSAGLLTPQDYREYVMPYVADILSRLQMYRRPAIIYVNGCGHLLNLMVRTGPQVIALDWRLDLEKVRIRLPENVSIQGNLDPSVMLGPPDLIRDRAVDILIQGTLYRGHIFNLGGGILPETPPENVQALVDIVRDFDPALQGWRSVRS